MNLVFLYVRLSIWMCYVMSLIAGNWSHIYLCNHHLNVAKFMSHWITSLLLSRYITVFPFKFWTDAKRNALLRDLDEHASTSSEGNIYCELSMNVQHIKYFFMFQKMMTKKQRGRRPSKPKGKGLLCCLRRNAKQKILKQIYKSKRRWRRKKQKKRVLTV